MKWVLCLALLISPISSLALDRDCLAITVSREAAAGNDRDGKAVLQVVENRMRIQGKNACAIVKQRKQFSFVTKDMSWKATRKQLQYLLKLYEMEDVVTDKTTYFHNVSVKPKWAKQKKFVKQIFKHKFYEEK